MIKFICIIVLRSCTFRLFYRHVLNNATVHFVVTCSCGMASLGFLSFLLIHFVMTINAKRESALFRNAVGDFSVGDFKQNPFHYLWVKNLASSMAADETDCTFFCVGEPKCRSFNMAATPDSKGFYLCELLASDKYAAKIKFHANATFHHYSPKSSCESYPCMNGADCVPEYELNTYHCNCKQGFFGTHCEHGENKTCSAFKRCNPDATSGSYVIDPDGKGGMTPFTVFCDMTDKNGVGITVVSHNSEKRTLVYSDRYKSRGGYVRNVTYSGAGLTSVTQLAKLTDFSAHCEQFIKYECHHSMLLRNGNMFGWWVSRDDNKMTYWGGANSAPYKCACSVSGTCANPSYGCNCDQNDQVWREDSGLLINKSHLPVIQLRFGDVGPLSQQQPGQQGYHTLGKLKCYGIN